MASGACGIDRTFPRSSSMQTSITHIRCVWSCHVRTTAMHTRPFPSPTHRCQRVAMTASPLDPRTTAPGAGVHRVADMVLRGSTATLRARVYWPRPASADPPALLVVFDSSGAGPGGADARCHELCAQTGSVVLSMPTAPGSHPAAFVDATEWAADHAAELDADPGRIVLLGVGVGVEIAVAVARHALREGWPPLAKVLLVDADQHADPQVGQQLARLPYDGPLTVVVPADDLARTVRRHLDQPKGTGDDS
ncbi:MAG: alpha/beta hydrolase fold domain-containing protein [Propionibacteriales bacterium]|nr:alpha/beta hydrolase fold domain-containing protein [Propionibacteriales bacterium]